MSGTTAADPKGPDQRQPVKASQRLPFLLPGGVALVIAILAGLARMGWELSLPSDLSLLHGPLMVAGMFGTVIGLERAVALGKSWAYLSPALSGAGAIAAIIGIPLPLAAVALILGAAVLLLASLAVLRIQLARHTVVLAIGAAALPMANILWLLEWDTDAVVSWWLAFLVLTIVGERLELSRLRPIGSGAKNLFLGLCAMHIAAVLGLTFGIDGAAIGFGLSLAGFAVWLILFDIARQTVKLSGLTRFIALCLLSGYGWLGLGALILALPEASGLAYAQDAALHAVFLGFVFAMVFGHAPITLPAVTGLRVPFRTYFYGHLALLQITLAARLVADFAALDDLRLAAGLGNAVTLILFILGTAWAVWRGRSSSA